MHQIGEECLCDPVHPTPSPQTGGHMEKGSEGGEGAPTMNPHYMCACACECMCGKVCVCACVLCACVERSVCVYYVCVKVHV